MSVTGADEARRGAATDSVTFAFGDARAQLYGLARIGLAHAPDGALQGSALAVLFSGREPVAALAHGALPVPADVAWDALALDGVRTAIDVPLSRWSVAFDAADGQGFSLTFEAVGDPAALADDEPAARLGGMAGYDQPCRVRRHGPRRRPRARDRRARPARPLLGRPRLGPDRGGADLTRVATEGACASLTAIRPAGSRNHADEETWAAVWEPEGLVPIEDGRLSTTYDADGHTRRAGLELWPAGEDEWARRAAGEVLCGSSLDLGALRLDCAFFRWQFEGQAGVGRYDIVRRAA